MSAGVFVEKGCEFDLDLKVYDFFVLATTVIRALVVDTVVAFDMDEGPRRDLGEHEDMVGEELGVERETAVDVVTCVVGLVGAEGLDFEAGGYGWVERVEGGGR